MDVRSPGPSTPAIRVVDDPDDLLASAGAMLLEREGLNQNLLATIGAARTDPDHTLALVEADGGGVLGVFARRGTWSQLAAVPGTGAVVGEAVGRWLVDRAEPIRSIESDHEAAEAVAAAYLAASGRTMAPALGLGVMECTRVEPPRSVEGSARRAIEADLPLVQEWYVAFDIEANHGVSDPEALRSGIRRRVLDPQPRPRILVWDVDGRPVSFVIAGGQTPTGEVIHAVYTPAELRGHGYAGALVADETQRILDRGLERVFLQADAANPISNALYRKIGYRDIGVTERWDVAAEAEPAS